MQLIHYSVYFNIYFNHCLHTFMIYYNRLCACTESNEIPCLFTITMHVLMFLLIVSYYQMSCNSNSITNDVFNYNKHMLIVYSF